MVALGATFVTNQRRIHADEFFVDLFETALSPNEIILRVEFPVPQRAAYAKFANQASGYAVVGVLVADFGDSIRVGVTGAVLVPFVLVAWNNCCKLISVLGHWQILTFPMPVLTATCMPQQTIVRTWCG